LIFVVEDDDADKMLFEEACAAGDLGLRLEFFDGAEALQARLDQDPVAGTARPALILLDLNMPGTSGLEVLQWLRARRASAILPVVVFSTSWFEEDVRACYAAGANAFLVKPLRFEELVTTLKAFRSFWVDTARLPSSGRA